jgi:predicted N-formylglutamate amidohydrolase
MNKPIEESLLDEDKAPAFEVCTAGGRSEFLIIADHAGHRVPRRLRQLGLPDAELQRHIGWDIGIAGLARRLGERLDATAILQRYSRLVIDCNRPLEAGDSIATVSDGTEIAANFNLTPAEREARVQAIFEPYHRRIAAELDARQARSRPSVLVALHSFTPRMNGAARPWHAGVLYARDARFALALLALLRKEPGLQVGDNQPYAASEDTDYAVPRHGEARGLLHVELEIRQDLIASAAGQDEWSQRLARLLPLALRALPH